MKKKLIAVVGAGRMGCGIAQVFLDSGFDVHLYDPIPGALERAKTNVGEMHAMLGGETSALQCLGLFSDLSVAVGSADVVIEAVPENLVLKQELFAQLELQCQPNTLLATNTSAIPIASIGERLKTANRFLGMHFWNPPHLVPLVEVVQGTRTDPSQVAAAMELLTTVGMEPVHVFRDIPGFIGNRLQHALKREAIALVADGVCDAETVDRVVKLGFGSRLSVMGPLEQSDLVGLGLTLAIHEVLMPAIDRTPEAHPYLRSRVAAGETGMSVGKGFRSWTKAEADQAKKRLDSHLISEAKLRRTKRRIAFQAAEHVTPTSELQSLK